MKQGEIDGVPCFWTEAEGPLLAGLVFGVGMGDETFRERGLTHLIEHLSLHSIDRDLPHNGQVDTTTTMMHCRGTVDEVRRFFEDLVANLAALPYTELERECRVLSAESEQRGRWIGSDALNMLYGLRGPGATSLPEFGLWDTTPAAVETWRRRHFVRSNAAAFFHGPAPAGISFAGLEEGPKPVRDALPPLLIDGASFVHLGVAGPCVFAPQARGVGHSITNQVAVERVTARLREDRGITYAVHGGATELDANTQLLALSADSTAEHSTEAFELMRVELQRLAEQGPTEDEVDRQLRMYERAALEPGFDAGECISRARFAVDGRPYVAFEDAMHQIRSMSTTQLAAPFRAALERAVWIVPPGTGVQDARLHPIPPVSDRIAEGTSFESKYDPRVLIVGVDEVTVCLEHGPVTVSLGELEGATRFQDGGWTLHGSDGFVVGILASDFDAEEAVAAFTARIPADRIVNRKERYRSEEEQSQLVPKIAPKARLRDRLRSKLNSNDQPRVPDAVPTDDPLEVPGFDVHRGHPAAVAFSEAVIRGDWTAAERLFGEQPTPADQSHLVAVASSIGGTPQHLDPWVELAGTPGLPLLVRGAHGIVWGWTARSAARAESVSAAMFQEFHRRLRLAEKDLVDATTYLPDSPLPWAQLLTAGRGLQIPQSEQQDRYVALVDRGATLAGHMSYQQYICDKWFGSHDEMWEHVEWIVDSARPGAPELGLAPLAFMEHLIGNDLSYDTPSEFLRLIDKADLLTAAAVKSYGKPEFPLHRIDAASTLSFFFTYCWLNEQWEAAQAVVPMIGDRFDDFGMRYFATTSWPELRDATMRRSA